MTAIMYPTESYLDFFDIAAEAYKSGKRDIYRKLITTLIAIYTKLLHDIEMENIEFENSEALAVNEEDLDLFYEKNYTMIDSIKLLKAHIAPFKNQDGLFDDLYNIADKLHDALIYRIELVSTQEVKTIRERYAEAS